MTYKTTTVFTCDNCHSDSEPIEQTHPPRNSFEGVDPNPPDWIVNSHFDRDGVKPFTVGGWNFTGILCEGCVVAVRLAAETAFNARRHPSLGPIFSPQSLSMRTERATVG